MHKDDKEKDMEKPEALMLEAGLYCVATPIGNLRDITLRALDVLRSADVILCEDTRVTSKLMRAYQIEARLRRYDDYSGKGERDHVVGMIESGCSVALVSDAGTPLVSDPGYKLVRCCQEAGVYVTTVPGANAPLSALQLSGLPSDKFCFLGFLPPRATARRKMLSEWGRVDASLIVFETAPRLYASLRDIEDVLDGREVAVVREITKMFEEVRRDVPQALLQHYERHGLPKGEIVLVIAPCGDECALSLDDPIVFGMLREALATMKIKTAAKDVAQKTGLKASDLYNIALKMSDR